MVFSSTGAVREHPANSKGTNNSVHTTLNFIVAVSIRPNASPKLRWHGQKNIRTHKQRHII